MTIGKRFIFHADPLPQEGCVQQGEDDGDRPLAEDKGQHHHLGRHDDVVGVAEKAVRPPAHQRRAGQGNDAGRPETAEADDHPPARQLQRNKKPEQPTVRLDGRIPRHGDRNESRCVQRYEQRVVVTPVLDAAGRQQPPAVALDQYQFEQPLERNQADDRVEPVPTHDGADWRVLTVKKPAVKPGPNVDNRWSVLALSASARCNTTKTVAADMLPNSRSTARA